MKKSLFFNHYSKTFENIENVINVIEEIQNVSNAYLIPLLTIKRDLIQLSNELRIELRQFITEEQMRENFLDLTKILETDLDENSMENFFLQ